MFDMAHINALNLIKITEDSWTGNNWLLKEKRSAVVVWDQLTLASKESITAKGRQASVDSKQPEGQHLGKIK